MTTITRRYRFSASHRLQADALSAEENVAIFGKCNNPFGHGHDYTLSVTVSGEPDDATGLILSMMRLDELVEQSVLQIVAHRNLNLDVAALRDIVPTTENVVRVVAGLLEAQWAAWFGEECEAQLARIQLQETERNGFAIDLPMVKASEGVASRSERVPLYV